jgi:L-fucose isomerase-like protein
MEPLEQILQEITAFENQLSRRSFIGAALLLAAAPGISLGRDDQQFLDAVAATLIPANLLQATGIHVAQNVEYLLSSGSSDHRRKVTRFIAWSQRAAILYGGERVALNARGSRFMLVRKMGRTLSSLCLIAFWADERSLKLIDDTEVRA